MTIIVAFTPITSSTKVKKKKNEIMNEFIDNSLVEDEEDEVYAQQQQHQQEQKDEEHEHLLQEQNLPLINEQKKVLQDILSVQNYEQEELEQKEHVINVHQQQNESTNEEKYDNANDTIHPLQPIDGNFMAEYDADKRESDYNSLTVLINTLEEELARTDDKNAKELQLHIEQNKNLRLQVEKLLYKRETDLRSFVKLKSTKELPEEINNDNELEEEEERSSEFANGLVLLESAYRMRLNEEEEDEYIHLLGQTSQEIMWKAHFKEEQYKKLIHYIQAGKERAIKETTQPLTQFISEILTNKIAEMLQLESEFNNTLTVPNHKTIKTKEEAETMLQQCVLSTWSNSREDENHLFVVLAERLEQELQVNMELRQIYHNMRRELQELLNMTNTFNIKLEKYYTALLEEIMFSVSTMNCKRTRAGMPVIQDSHVSNVPTEKNTLNSVPSPFHNDAAPTITNNNTDNIYINNTRHECDVQAKLISQEIQLLSSQVQHDIETLQRMIMYVRQTQMSTEQEREREEENTELLLSLTYRWLQYEVNTWHKRVEWQRAHWQHSDVSFATLLCNVNHEQNFISTIDSSSTNWGEEISSGDVNETNTSTSICKYSNTIIMNKLLGNYRQLTNFVVELHEKVIGTLSHDKVDQKNDMNEWDKSPSNLSTPFVMEQSSNVNALHTQPIKWFHIPSLLLLQGVVELQDVCLHSVAQLNAAYRKNAHWCTLMKFFALQAIGKSELNELDDVQLHEQLRSSLESLGITPNTEQLNTSCDTAPEYTPISSSILCNEYATYVLLSRTWRSNYISNMQRKFANILSSYKSMLENKCHALASLKVLLLQLVQQREETYGSTLSLSSDNNMNEKENTLQTKLIPLPKLKEQAAWLIIIHDNNKDINDSMERLISNAVHAEQERINEASSLFLHSVDVAVTEEHENTIKKLMWIEQHPQGQMLLKLRDLLKLNQTLKSKLEEKMSASPVNTITTSTADASRDEDEGEGEAVDMNRVHSHDEHNTANGEEEHDSNNLLFDEKNANADETEEEEKVINAKIAQLEQLISHEKHHSEELEHKIKALSKEVVV